MSALLEALGDFAGVDERRQLLHFERGLVRWDPLGPDVPERLVTLVPLASADAREAARRAGTLRDGDDSPGWSALDEAPFGWRACPSDEWCAGPVAWLRLRALVDVPVAWLTTEEAARRLRVAPQTLREMAQAAPTSIPGGPVAVGTGGRRTHLRWPAAGLDAWLRAAAASSAAPPAPAPAHPARGTRRRRPSPTGSLLSRATRDDDAP